MKSPVLGTVNATKVEIELQPASLRIIKATFCRRSLAGVNVWDSLADLLKIMKLRGVCAHDVKEVREIVQHLFTNIVKHARSKRDSRQAKTHVDNLLSQVSARWRHAFDVERGPFPGSSPRIDEEGNQWACKMHYCRAWQKSPSHKRSGDKKTTRWTGSSKHAYDGHKLRRKGKRHAADSRGTDWRGGGRHGGV